MMKGVVLVAQENQKCKEVVRVVTIEGKRYEYESWMSGMTKKEVGYMLKARYATAFFRWYPDL